MVWQLTCLHESRIGCDHGTLACEVLVIAGSLQLLYTASVHGCSLPPQLSLTFQHLAGCAMLCRVLAQRWCGLQTVRWKGAPAMP